MDVGYIYCFSNQSMYGLLNIGATFKKPITELLDSNVIDKWKPPMPYKVEFIKRVKNPFQKEKALHTILSQYTKRINPDRNFFRVPISEVKELFDLMDEINDNEETSDNSNDEIEENETISELDEDELDEDELDEDELDEDVKIQEKLIKPSSKITRRRDMTKYFTDGQRIRHKKSCNTFWVCTYSLLKNSVIYNGKFLSLNQFVKSHYELERPDRTCSANAWDECECEIDGKWKKIINLSELSPKL